MRTYLECIPCFVRQALQAGKIATKNKKLQKQIMDETKIAQICLIITIIGILIFGLTYKEEFEETTINQLLSKEGNKGILHARIDYVVKNYPTTTLSITDGNKTTIYYPKATTFEKNNFVKIYAQSQLQGKKLTLFAYKIITE